MTDFATIGELVEGEFAPRFYRAFMTFCANWPQNGGGEVSAGQVNQLAARIPEKCTYAPFYL
jgi:hypothetical protein